MNSFQKALVILALTTFSCTEKVPEKILSKDLLGTWILSNEEYSNNLILDFDENHCLFLGPFGNFTKYRIYQDTLTIESETEGTIDFLLIALDSSSLTLNYLSSESTKEYIKEFLAQNSSLTLKKSSRKNDYEVKSILFLSGICFGSCPSIAIEIDNNGIMSYYGGAYSDFKGAGTARLNRDVFNGLKRSLNSINIESLQNEYTSPWTDDATYYLKIQFENKPEITISSYGFGETPAEVSTVIYKLLKIHEVSSITPVSKGELNATHEALQKRVAPEEYF